MLDNKAQSENARRYLRDLDYAGKVMIFDINCKNCPYVQYLATGIAPYSGKPTEFNCGMDMYKAIHIASSTIHGGIKRRCSFNDASMEEVVLNGCRFWSPTTCEIESEEDEVFIEVQEETEWLIPTIR